jgi:putative heme-binding domain-containing protein
MRALDRPVDRFLDYALWLTARDLQSVWLPEVQAGRFDFGGNTRHTVFALRAVGSSAAVKPLVDSLRGGRIPEAQQEGALTLIAALGQPRDLAMVFDLAVDAKASSSSRRSALLTALLKASRQRKARPDGDLTRLRSWLDGRDESLRVLAAEAVGLWKVEPLRPSLVTLARSADTPDPLRRAAIDTLAQLGGPESRKTIEQLAASGAPRRTQTLAVGALATLDLKAASDRAAERLARAGDTSEVDELVGRFLQFREGPNRLGLALEGKTLPTDVAKLAIRAVRASGRDEAKLLDALAKAGNLSSAPRPLSPEQMKAFVTDVARKGDPARGEAVFRRKETACFKCHAIVGAGGQVGPSLESVGASAPVDYLVDSLIEPGKAIKENFHSLVVATKDGQVVTGIKVRQSDAELLLRDAEDREVAIPLSAIDEQKNGGSLMPTGLTETITRAEFVDLVRFLSELGKIGAYSVSKARVARRWRVAEMNAEATAALAGSRLESAVRDKLPLTWVPAYSQVSGTLPLADLSPIATKQGRIGLARAQIDVSTPGAVKLATPNVEGLRLWVDGNEVQVKPEMQLDLPSGVHTLTWAVDLHRRREGTSSVLEDVPGSPARAQWVVGK